MADNTGHQEPISATLLDDAQQQCMPCTGARSLNTISFAAKASVMTLGTTFLLQAFNNGRGGCLKAITPVGAFDGRTTGIGISDKPSSDWAKMNWLAKSTKRLGAGFIMKQVTGIIPIRHDVNEALRLVYQQPEESGRGQRRAKRQSRI